MQTPKRKQKKALKQGKLILTISLGVAVVIAGILFAYAKKEQAKPYIAPDVPLTSATLKTAEQADIISLEVHLKDEEDYVLFNREGSLYLEQAAEPINSLMAADILDCLMPLAAQETLTDDMTPYLEHLGDFGLEDPLIELTVHYTDGETLQIKVGDEAPENGHRYMMLSGDSHLYLCTTALYDALYFNHRLFYQADQITMASTRIDQITVAGPEGETLFQYSLAKGFSYEADTSDETVQNSFFLTAPVNYPADSEWISPILTALENFVLGPKVAADTPENRALYGLTEPEYVLTVHQAQGIESATDSQGVITRSPAPERTDVFELGGAYTDTLRYLAYNGNLHLFNRYQLVFVKDLKPLETLQKNPLDVPMALLKAFVIDEDRYELDRIEQANEDGQTEIVLTVTKNGQEYDAALFESRYEKLAQVTVSGRLPSSFAPSGEVLRTIKLELHTGEARTITLMPFDGLHNAVGVDGVYLYYLIQGGLTF